MKGLIRPGSIVYLIVRRGLMNDTSRADLEIDLVSDDAKNAECGISFMSQLAPTALACVSFSNHLKQSVKQSP